MVKDSDPESNHFLAASVPKTSITPCIVRPPTPPQSPTHTHTFIFLSTHSSFHSILPFSSRVIFPHRTPPLLKCCLIHTAAVPHGPLIESHASEQLHRESKKRKKMLTTFSVQLPMSKCLAVGV